MNDNEFYDDMPADNILLEDEAEDKLLARALEESLRHYREVEIPLRQSQLIDEKSQTAKPGTSQDDAFSSTTNVSAEHLIQTTSKSILYEGKDAEGFDLSAGHIWIYPTNYPVRQYQYDIVKCCLFKNTLVSLPTGLGKTFIAAVVMYNFYRWFPRGKVIFMAPTKPLVHQQIESCYKVMGIPKDDTAEVTGSMSPPERAVAWKRKRVFFLTPQVLTNDLTSDLCPAASIKCVVVDEAHKALGNYSYCQVMKALLPLNNKFRVLALSATPGCNLQAVTQVVRNLMISHMELRNEDSPDVTVFTHKRHVETVVVSLGTYLSSVRERFMLILDKHLGFLRMHKVLYGSMAERTKFGILKARDMFRQNPPSHILRAQSGHIEARFAVCITLLHSLELLSLYGLRSFHKFLVGVLNENRGTAVVHTYLKNESDLEKLLDELREKLGPDNQVDPEPDKSMPFPHSGQESASYLYSHPKVEKLQDIVVHHFKSFQEKNVVTRAMIFCQYRDIVIEVCHILQKHHPLIKPMTFVGQSSTGKNSKGFTQKQQLKVMHKFKAGGYNTLISTCVGEEGLDIGEVDLIVCFDAHKSPIRLVQRMGRTGRQREGRIVMLVTEGKEHSNFKTSMYQNQTMNKKLLEGSSIRAHMYGNNPRMIPPGVEPQCHRMFITVPTDAETYLNKKKQRLQDIRKLMGNPSNSKVIGLRRKEVSSPYCTEDELADFWGGRTVPAFDRFRDMEELHSKGKRELHQAFNVDRVSNQQDDSQKLDLGKWLQWQQTLQSSVLVRHTDDSRMLTELLQYAENLQCPVESAQTEGVLSKEQDSLIWLKQRRKGKHFVKRRVRSPASECEVGTHLNSGLKHSVNKDQEIDKAYTEPEVVQFESIAVESSCIPLLQTTAEDMKENADGETNAKSYMELKEMCNDHSCEIAHNFLAEKISGHKAFPEKNDLTSHDLCYFCKNSLFYCHHIMACSSAIRNKTEDCGCYKPLDPCALDNFTEANVNAFDLRQFLDLENGSVNEGFDHNIDISVIKQKLTIDCNPESASQVQSQKNGGNMKINFHLDFDLFEKCLFEDELLPGNPIGNLKDEVAVPEVDQKTSHSDVNVCPHNRYRNSDLVEIESRRDSMITPKREMEDVQESPGMCPSSIAAGIANKPRNIEHLPLRGGQMESCLDSTNHSPKETPNKPCNLLFSPVSPIFCSAPKNVILKPTRTVPVCSTPKTHKKNLFPRCLRTVQEEGGNLTSSRTQRLEVKGEKSVDTVMAGDCEDLLLLNSLVSNVPSPPRPNFDLFGVTQELFNLESDAKRVEHLRNQEVCTSTTLNSTMYTVTQLLGMVSKTISMENRKEFQVTSQQNTVTDVEELVLPCESVEGAMATEERSKHVQECSENVLSCDVPSKFSKSHTIAHMSSDSINYALKDKPSDATSPGCPIVCSQIRKYSHSPTNKMTCPAVQEVSLNGDRKSEEEYLKHDYLRDSDDDIFADLAVDCCTLTACEQSSPVTSAIVQGECAVDIVPETHSDRSVNHEVVESEDGVAEKQVVDPVLDFGVASVKTLVPKISESVVGNSLPTTAVRKPLLSRMSSKYKLKESAKFTCMENLSVKIVGSSLDKSSAESKRRNIDRESPSRIIRDEIQYAEVSNAASNAVFCDTKKETSRSKNFEGQADWLVSFGSERTVLHNKGISEKERVTCRAPTSDDDSPVMKPLVRNRKINISSISNESVILSPHDTNNPPQNTSDEKEKQCKSFPVQHCGWLTSRMSNRPRFTAGVNNNNNNNNNLSGNKLKDSYVPVMTTDVIEISSEDDSDFESQSLVRLKKRNEGKVICETDKNVNQRKTLVKKKSKHSLPRCIFVEREAEESGSCPSSSFNEEDISGFDDYDSSFVSESGNQTHTDIQAKFLHSIIRSPGDRCGRFKMPAHKPAVPLDSVFSEVEADFETSYLDDSFCVNEEPQSEEMEASALEVAEAILEAESKWKRRRRKRKGSSSVSDVSDCGEGTSGKNVKSNSIRNNKRYCRIITLESSDSEDFQDVSEPLPKECTESGNSVTETELNCLV